MTVSKSIPTDLINSLLAGYQRLEDLIGENGLLKQLTKTLVERALEAKKAVSGLELCIAPKRPMQHPTIKNT
jgi:hypothetical protein